jgi:hypothetical protein
MQKNLLQAEVLCSDSIATAVRSLLPIKNILNEYLSDDVMAAEPVIEEAEEIKPISGGSLVASPVVEPVTEPTPVVSPVKAIVEEPVTQEPVTQEPVAKEAVSQEIVESEKVVEPVAETPAPELVVSEIESTPVPAALVPELEMPMPDLPKPAEPEEIVIDTEPAVHFSDYDNVFDESKEQVGTFAYNPKNDDNDVPQMQIIEDAGTPLAADESVTNLEVSGGGLMEADEVLE